MGDSRRLKVGVIGCGGIAQMMHLPYLQNLSERFEVVALCDLSRGVLTAMGHRYHVPEARQFLDYRDLIKLEDIDAVIILSAGNHAEQSLTAIQAGKHVLVEKPMCFTLAEADAIIAAQKEANVKLMVGYMKRYDPGFVYAQNFIQSMEDIQYVQINTLHPSENDYRNIHNIVRVDDIPTSVIEALRNADDTQIIKAVGEVDPFLRGKYANLFLGSMIHDTNALRGLLGEPEKVLFTEMWPNKPNEVSVTTVIRYPKHIRVVYTWTFLEALRDYFQEIAVMSSDNRVRIQFPSPYLDSSPTPILIQGMEDGSAYTKRVEVSYDDAFKCELIAFHDCVVNDSEPLTDARDGRGDIALLQQIFATMQPKGLAGEATQI